MAVSILVDPAVAFDPQPIATVLNSDQVNFTGGPRATLVNFTETAGFTLLALVNLQGRAAATGRVWAGALHAASSPASTPTLGAVSYEALNATDDDYEPSGLPTALLGNYAARAPMSLRGQGWTVLALRSARSSPSATVWTPFVQGVAIEDIAGTEAPAVIDAIIGGGYGSNLAALTSGVMQAPDLWARVELFDRPLTDHEIGNRTRRLIAGAPTPNLAPKLGWIWLGDSLTAFGESPPWPMRYDERLRPGFLPAMDAIGGSFFQDIATGYAAPYRVDLLRRRLHEMSLTCAETPMVLGTLTNDIGGQGRPMSTLAGWRAGEQAIFDFYFGLRAELPPHQRARVTMGATTTPARYDWLPENPSRTANGATWEQVRLARNEHLRANWQALGFDYLFDLAAFVPPGYASMEAAAIAAVTSNGAQGDPYNSGGLHFTAAGGAMLSRGVYVERAVDRMVAIGAIVRDTAAPVFTSPAAVSVAENLPLAHLVSWTDASKVSLSIVGGADAALFELSGATLRWAGNGAQDFENPADANLDNVYAVTVRATDVWGNFADQTIAVTVTDAADTKGFAVIETTSSGVSPTSNLTTYTPAMPAGIVAGDVIVLGLSADGAVSFTVPGFTLIGSQTAVTTLTGAIYWRVADGTAADNPTVTCSAAEMFSHVAYRMSNATQASASGMSSGSAIAANIDPPAHTPAGGANDYLWLAFAMTDGSIAPTAAPSGYSGLIAVAHPSGAGASIGAAHRTAAGSTEDPGAFTNAAARAVAFTVSVV